MTEQAFPHGSEDGPRAGAAVRRASRETRGLPGGDPQHALGGEPEAGGQGPGLTAGWGGWGPPQGEIFSAYNQPTVSALGASAAQASGSALR